MGMEDESEQISKGLIQYLASAYPSEGTDYCLIAKFCSWTQKARERVDAYLDKLQVLV